MAEEITLDNFNATFDDDESEIESSNSSTTMNTSSLHDGGKKRKKLLLVGLVSVVGVLAIAIGLGISFSPSKTGEVSSSLETDTSSTSATLSLECLALDEYSWYNSSTWVPTWSPTSPSSEDEDSTYSSAAAESDFLPINYDLISTDDEDDKVDILPLDVDTDDRLQNMIASNGGEDIRRRRRELRMRKSMMTDLAKDLSDIDNGNSLEKTRKRHLEECTVMIEDWIAEMCSSETSEYVSNDESESESSLPQHQPHPLNPAESVNDG